MRTCEKTSVGIWWFYYDEVLFEDSVAVENGLPYVYFIFFHRAVISSFHLFTSCFGSSGSACEPQEKIN